MTLPSDGAVTKGDLMRRLAGLERRMRQLGAARRLQASSISSGGITVKQLEGAETFIGSDIPAAVSGFYNFFAFEVLSVTIYRFDADNYVFDALVRQNVHGNQNLVRGSVIDGVFFSGSQLWIGEIGGGQFAGIGTIGAGILNIGTGLFPFSTLSIWNNWEIAGINQGRGLRNRVDATSDSATIGAEAVASTGGSMTFENGRCYRASWSGKLTSSAAQTTTVRIRKTNLAGAILDAWPEDVVAGTLVRTRQWGAYVKNVSGANITTNLVMTLQASAGTIIQNGGATFPRNLEVYDCGAASFYTNAAAIT